MLTYRDDADINVEASGTVQLQEGVLVPQLFDLVLVFQLEAVDRRPRGDGEVLEDAERSDQSFRHVTDLLQVLLELLDQLRDLVVVEDGHLPQRLQPFSNLCVLVRELTCPEV